MLSEMLAAQPTGHSLVMELDAAKLFAYPTERGGVMLLPQEEITDAIRARMRPHKDLLFAYLTERVAIEQTLPLTWADAAAGAEPDACAAHIEARGFCYRRPELLDGAKIIVAKNDCPISPFYLSSVVYYECELPGLASMTQDNAARLHFDKGRLLPGWSGMGWWSEIDLMGKWGRAVGGLAAAAGMPQDAAHNLLDYLCDVGVATSWTMGGGRDSLQWRLLPPAKRGQTRGELR